MFGRVDGEAWVEGGGMFIDVELSEELRGGQLEAEDASAMGVSCDDDRNIDFH
jgi:hypothetical protein